MIEPRVRLKCTCGERDFDHGVCDNRDMKPAIRNHLDRFDVINDVYFPEWDRALNALRCRGQITAVLPGIFSYTHSANDFSVRVAAAAASTRHYVLVGRSAAKYTWWPELECSTVSLAHVGRLEPKSGFEFSDRHIPPALIDTSRRIPVTTNALTVLDLIPEYGPGCVDEALRRRAVTIPGLREALRLTPYRRGNSLRRDILSDSRDSPWSALEREAHRLLRREKFKGWRTNFEVNIDGEQFFLDVAFPSVKICIEIDGYEFHGSRAAFHQDRRRGALLAREGWIVLHFSSETLSLLPEALRSALRRRRSGGPI